MSENYSTEGGRPIPKDASIKNRGKYGKYWDKTANVRARRKAYGWFLVVALLLVAVALVDIFVIEGENDYIMMGVVGAFLVLIIIAIMMLITRTNEYAKVADEETSGELQAAVLQCPECKHIFELKEQHFTSAKKVAFTCPSCGTYGAMPDMSQRPVKKVLPEGDVREYVYGCSNCHEEIHIGVFGDTEARQSRFRACPHCGEKDTVELLSRPPPLEKEPERR